ncbi:helix-turn-helix domain-containing protein [Streptantibioticus ferralitis]|uniref:Helix-turn-helix transcriptional regulator n=1 Tax=Streptantibioticus ferralitis TaxID=236510 RepID=A0ABT5YX45_9ACTN|nr:helix-turn-helix transcriptional regulator [Streptantibioticus ferralitis]MDF2256048.1 helix-turn-helix transcriptional regulator [Streptantibioticus ferralitis]
MPEETHSHIGARLREVRKRRGLTQRGLASASGVSLSLIRKLEQGERADTRLETARQLAVALRVPTTRFIAEHPEDGADATTMDHWGAVRRALLTPGPPGPGELPTANGVRQAIDAALPLFASDQFAELGTVLPALLRDADTLVEITPEGRRIRGRLLQLTGWLLTQTRQFDAAATALERAMDDAGDRLDGATTVSIECWLMLRRGRVADARDLAIRWADEVEPRMSRATPEELSAWGWLLLRASAASIRDNRPGEAEDALRLARSAAVAMGAERTPGDFLRTFGPVTVALKRAETAMIADEPDKVLKLAAAIPTKGLRPTSNNVNRHRLDVANAHVRQRQYADAVDVLKGIRGVAPQWLPHQRYARDIVERIITKRRTLTTDMRELADAVGMHV